MRTLPLLLLLCLLTACAVAPAPAPSPSPFAPLAPLTQEAKETPTKAGGELQVEILPDSTKSFKPVAGRVPFTVTLSAQISGGVPPYQVAWDFGQGMRVEEKPRPVTFTRPGEYTATVTVQDRDGQTARAARRLVAFDTPSMPAWKYGVTAHLERRRAGFYPALEEVKRACDLAQAAGVQVVRIDFNWDQLNPAPGRWNFDDYDAMVRIVREHRLDILAIVDYTSWWASSAQDSNDWRVRLYSEPRSNYEFARYAYELARHFKNDVRAWEIWNEPNTAGFWKPRPNAAHYAQLLQEAYVALKYADPQAVVVFGGVSGNGVDGDDASGLASNFLAGAYAAGAKHSFDVMAIHPYLLPNSGIAALRAKITATQAVLKQNGDAQVPLWLTEIGAPTNAPWWPTAPVQTEEGVAAWLEQVYTRLWDQTPTIVWYDLQEQGAGETAEERFGLLRVDFSTKPAYGKYRALTDK